MQEPPPEETQYLQFWNNESQNIQNQGSPESAIQKQQRQYFYIKLTLSVILVIIATASVQTQMQFYAPFVRTVQNFFNYHILKHDSQDIYEGGTVIFYRTQQYKLSPHIMEFFDNYVKTMESFHQDSFFYSQESTLQSRPQIVKILIISEINQKNRQFNSARHYLNQIILNYSGSYQKIPKNRYLVTGQEQHWILQRPIQQLQQFFESTVFTKIFYQIKIKKIQLTTKLYIKFKEGKNCTVQVKTIGIFYSQMMMAAKVQTNVYDDIEENLLSNSLKTNFSQVNDQFDQQNLGIRKLSQFHNLSFNFQYMGYVIFIVNAILFCVQLMIIVRTNQKINQNLMEQKQFQRQFDNFQEMIKKKNTPKTPPQKLIQLDNKYQQIKLVYESQPIINSLSYKERLEIIGIYNIVQLLLSFFVLITVSSKGVACFLCWAKMSIYLSQTGNRMMIGFLFKKAIPAYIIVILNLSICLSGFVFYSMVTFRISKKFQTVQLSYYEYLFNYFQYGIFENFRPIEKYGSLYSFLYFLQMAFLVLVGNNILQSILAQQVLKNSNMKDLIQFLQNIEVECPNCHSPPQVKKKIKLKLPNQSEMQSQLISRYFKAQKQEQNRSKYQIKILSPQFSPMYHTSQFKKKDYKLRKRSINNISIVGEQSILMDTPKLSPFSAGSPQFPLSPRMNEHNKKKVKFQIGKQVEESKFENFKKSIKKNSQILVKVIQQISKNQRDQLSQNRYFQMQVLKKKKQDIKKFVLKFN